MMNVLEILEVRHSRIPGWLEFQLKVRWSNGKVEDIPFSYNPEDDAPLTIGLRDKIVPKLKPEEILPALEPKVG
jgi:hypothetical protein